MKRKVAHSAEQRKSFIEKGFKEVGREENGNYVFWSNKMTDILSKRELQVFELQDKSDIEIAEILEVAEKTIVSYRKKIEDKGFYFEADAVINWGEIRTQ
jgi:ATP/maltotriose-dependent transcriptional regulator MalT